ERAGGLVLPPPRPDRRSPRRRCSSHAGTDGRLVPVRRAGGAGADHALPQRLRKGYAVSQFMVERHLAGFPPEQLPAAAAAAKSKAAELSEEGQDVRFVRSTWVP